MSSLDRKDCGVLERFKATILVDNIAKGNLIKEHGLSILIESDGKSILFDTGQGNALKHNSRVLDIDLGDLNTVVLSHGHYDHTGGLAHVLERAPNCELYCHPAVKKMRYSVRNNKVKEIQPPKSTVKALDNLSTGQLHWIKEPMMIDDRIGVTGPIPRKEAYEDTGGSFFFDTQGIEADLVEDDIAIWLIRDSELSVLTGCAHAGLVNTIEYIESINPGLTARTVIGGFHLVNASKERLQNTVKRLQKMDLIVPCHCTGKKANAYLKRCLGKRVRQGEAGMVFFI